MSELNFLECSEGDSLLDEEKPIIALFGATGGVGRWVLWQIQQNPRQFPFRVRAFVRDEERAQKIFKDLGFENMSNLEIFQGNLNKIETIKKALEGVTYVFITLGVGNSVDGGVGKKGISRAVSEYAVRSIANLCKETQERKEDGNQIRAKEEEKNDNNLKQGVRHIILISSFFVTRPSHVVTKLLNTLFDDDLRWKLRGENAVRRCGVNYTIIRPSSLDKISKYPKVKTDFQDFESKINLEMQRIIIDQGDRERGVITRMDVAHFGLEALKMTHLSSNTTFELYLGKGPSNLDQTFSMFSSLAHETEPQPDWELAEDVVKCFVCSSVFGLLTRRHRCRKCGKAVCSDCSSREKTIPEFGLIYPVRVCDSCFGKD